jgi:hypothetical protein
MGICNTDTYLSVTVISDDLFVGVRTGESLLATESNENIVLVEDVEVMVD